MTEPDRRQCQLIEAYLVDLWCPERPRWCYEGPAERVAIENDRAEFRWLRQLDHGPLLTLPYVDVVEAIRAA